ncbi:MAG TPA: cytochrome P450 [Ktedonobacterales bacterium]
MSRSLSEAPIAAITPAHVIAGNLPNRLARLAQEVGPLFRWEMAEPGREFVFLVGPEANRLVFNTRRDAFSHQRGWTPFIGDLLGSGLLNMDNPEHARARKMWNPAFTSAYMGTYLPLMQQVIAVHTSAWVERGEVDLYQESREIAFHIAASALAGIHARDEVAHLQRLFYLLLPRGGPAQGEDDDALWDRVYQARDELDGMLLDLITQRRATAADVASHDVLGMIVHARDEDGHTLTDREVLGHLYILLVAGHETTTTLAAWTLYYLATLPDERRRVEAELEALLGGGSAPLSVETARRLHVLDAFISESGRLHSPVQMVPRGVVEEVEFAGYTLPIGTRARVALAACHRLPQYFADPERFDLDRFLPPREEDRKTPYALVTFGGGPRLCIGVNVANIEVKALAAHVLRAYTLTPTVRGAPVDVGFITTSVPSGLPMRVTPRTR